jgi:hypothetical protein
MPRPLTAPTAEDFHGEELELYKELMASWMHGRPTTDLLSNAWFAALMNWPAYFANRRELSRLLLTIPERAASYSHADREWADIVLATYMNTNVVLRTHLPDALGAGVRLEAIEAIRARRDEDLTSDERLLAVFCRQVLDGTVDDATYEAVEAYMGERATVEYVIFVTCLWETMRQMNALGQDEPPDAEIDQMIADFKSGEREVPADWHQRAVGPWPGSPQGAGAQ